MAKVVSLWDVGYYTYRSTDQESCVQLIDEADDRPILEFSLWIVDLMPDSKLHTLPLPKNLFLRDIEDQLPSASMHNKRFFDGIPPWPPGGYDKSSINR